jgi:hypothetical protein
MAINTNNVVEVAKQVHTKHSSSFLNSITTSSHRSSGALAAWPQSRSPD